MKKAIEVEEIEQGEESSVFNEIPCLIEAGTTISTLFMIIHIPSEVVNVSVGS